MTNRRGRRGPEPNDDANLSDHDLERRLAGGAGLGGPVPERTPPPIDPGATIGGGGSGRGTTPGGAGGPGAAGWRGRGGVGGGRPARSPIWRDVGLVLALLLLLVVGARIVIPSEPTTAVVSPSPAASQVAIASPSAAATPTTVPTIAQPTESALPSDVIPSLEPEASPSPSVAPSSVPTGAPTPAPTPVPTPRPTPTPTPPPGSATLRVYLNVTDNSGGTATSASFHVTVSGASASPGSFAAPAPGAFQSVTVRAGATFSVTSSGPAGYTASRTADCSGHLSTGATSQCTLSEDDQPATLVVKIAVPSGQSPSDYAIQLDALGASPGGSVTESASGVTFHLDAHTGWSVAQTAAPSGYFIDTTSCVGGGLANGQQVTCTIYGVPGSALGPGGPLWAGLLLPSLLPLSPRPRRLRQPRRPRLLRRRPSR